MKINNKNILLTYYILPNIYEARTKLIIINNISDEIVFTTYIESENHSEVADWKHFFILFKKALINNPFYIIFFNFYLLFFFINYNLISTVETNLCFPLIYALTGNLLGDGWIGFANKDSEGKPTGNARFGFSQKSYDYIAHLYFNIYGDIVTPSLPKPWPNPKTRLPTQHYKFHSKALPALTELHSQWYYLSRTNNFIKKLPDNISLVLNPLALALWIMDDGYWLVSENTVFLCTDNFTLVEVKRLIEVLAQNFSLVATVSIRAKEPNKVFWRIRFSAKENNIKLLRTIVKPYFITSMLYKIGE
jgi:hypothetical protein